MSGTRRSTLEMQMDILTVIKHYAPVKLTHLMYKSNVNCSVLKEMINTLIRFGFVEEVFVGKKPRYKLTLEGEEVLKTYKAIIVKIPKQIEPIPVPHVG